MTVTVMMMMMIGQIEHICGMIIITDYYVLNLFMENCLMHFWLNYDFSVHEQTADTWDWGRPLVIRVKPLNPTLDRSVYVSISSEIGSIETFPFSIPTNGQFKNGKNAHNSY